MNRIFALLALLAPLPFLATSLFSYGKGAFPGTNGTGGQIPLDVARAQPSCGHCHRPFGGGLNLVVTLAPTKRILAKSEAISVTTSSTGGWQHPLQWAGFLSEVTAGQFSAGSNSQINSSALNVTHQDASNPNGRKWTYGYTAPATAGLVEMFTIVNTVNGNGQADGSDFWGFQGVGVAANTNTPVRLYVNETGIVLRGDACAGSFGNVPVLGGKVVPSVGNQQFALELHGAAPTSSTLLFLDANPNFPSIDLSPLGVTGCFLHNNMTLTFNATTSGGDIIRGDGTATYTLPIPNDNGYKGVRFQAQVMILDVNNGRQLPITMSNGVEITVQ